MSAKHRKHNDSASTESDLDSMDDNFAFIAGHTSWGFPYGTTWEEVGINPSLSLDEKKMLSTLDGVHSRLSAIGAESINDDLLDAADHIDAAMDNIRVWVEIESESKDNRTDSVQNEADIDDLPF